jgi:adenine phosphoribosyltransferase
MPFYNQKGGRTAYLPVPFPQIYQAWLEPISGARRRMSEAKKQVDVDVLKALVRTVPDFPKPGILFYDITTVLKDKTGFAQLIDALAAHYIEQRIDLVLGIEARGFIFGPALAYRLNAGFVPVRKPRKLPAPVARVTYDLEYGTDTLEIHTDAIKPGQRVILVDDLLATGGTMEATVKLVKQLGGDIVGLGFALELDFLKGSERFAEYDVFSLLHYDE